MTVTMGNIMLTIVVAYAFEGERPLILTYSEGNHFTVVPSCSTTHAHIGRGVAVGFSAILLDTTDPPLIYT